MATHRVVAHLLEDGDLHLVLLPAEADTVRLVALPVAVIVRPAHLLPGVVAMVLRLVLPLPAGLLVTVRLLVLLRATVLP